jgi:hypothetical protein
MVLGLKIELSYLVASEVSYKRVNSAITPSLFWFLIFSLRNTRAIARLLLLRAASLGFRREEAADRGGALRVSGCQLLHRAERGDTSEFYAYLYCTCTGLVNWATDFHWPVGLAGPSRLNIKFFWSLQVYHMRRQCSGLSGTLGIERSGFESRSDIF